jgi:peptidoglycan/LPS O-acetylase OafA/YrhL
MVHLFTSASSSTSSGSYRPDIDGLRAFAVLSVVGFHAFPVWVKGGFLGVDIFFVISGYLITTIIFEKLNKGTFSFSEFYGRRVKRIIPSLILILVCCTLFGYVALLADEYQQLGKHIAAASSFISNLVFWNESGYFDNAADTKPLLHLWSLGIEEQFYIAWPLLVWSAWKQKFNLFTITIFVWSVSFILNIIGIEHDNIATFYSPLTRFWELLTGSILSYLILYKHISPQKFSYIKSNVVGIIGFCILILSVFLINKNYLFPGWLALLPCAGTSLVIIAGNKSLINSKILSNKLAVWFGLISFPLYLWHWPLLSFARIFEGATPERSVRIMLVLLSILLSWLTFRFFERYIRFSKEFRYVLWLLVSLIFMTSLGSYIFFNKGLPQRSALLKSEFTEQVKKQFLWEYINNDNCLKKYPFKDAEKLSWWFCMKSSTLPPTLIILGNSYANQLYPGFINNQELKHHSVLSIGACDFGQSETNELNVDVNNPCFRKRISKHIEFIDDIVKKNKSIKFAIIAGLNHSPDEAYIAFLQKRISNYESKGIKVILFTPAITIASGFHPKACFTFEPLRKTAKDCSFSSLDRQRLYDDFKPVIESLKITNPQVKVFEQNQIFCENKNTKKCSYIKNGISLFRDGTHASEYGSKELQKYFTEWAKINTPEIFDLNLVKK